MPSTLDLDPVDFCGKQVMGFNEAFYTAIFLNPGLNELLTFVPGIKAKQQIVILGLLDLVGKTKQTGSCAPDVSDQIIGSSEKFWAPEYIEDRFRECWKDLLAKFTVWGLQNGIKKPDLTGTDFAIFLEERVVDGLKQSVYRILWFGDTAAALVANGGKVSDTVTLSDNRSVAMNIRYINGIDGFWKQFFTIAAANPLQREVIARNYGGIIAPLNPSAVASTIGGTLAAGTYYYKVVAVNQAGLSLPSAQVAATTTGTTGSVAISWDAVPNATFYRVYKGTVSNTQTSYFTVAGNLTTYTDDATAGAAGTPPTVATSATYATQKFTQADVDAQVITLMLQRMIDNADTRLSSDPNVMFYVTKSVADQYKRERRKVVPGVELSYTRTESGFLKLELDGLTLMVLDFEDRFIRMFFNNGTSLDRPHRVYMATKDNLQAGVEEENSLTDVYAFFVPESKYYYLDTGYSIDAKIIEDYRAAFAY